MSISVLSVSAIQELDVVAMSDDNKNVWFLQKNWGETPFAETLDYIASFKVNEQVNKIIVRPFKNKSGSQNKAKRNTSRNVFFNLFPDKPEIPVFEWGSCEGSLGSFIPITDQETLDNLIAFTESYTNTSTLADQNPTSSRKILHYERTNVIDGCLIAKFLKEPHPKQLACFDAFLE